LLEGVGAKADIANHGGEAVKKLFEGPSPPPYDMVLMDLQMPEMDGYQATTKIRSDQRFAHLPIIAMTAHATVEERQHCLNMGMNDHVSKPIDPALLYETLGRFYKSSDLAAGPDAPPALKEPGEIPSDEIPCIEGLNTKDGLARVAGNKTLYLKLLRQFAEHQGEAHSQIAEALAGNDSKLAERLAHTVKGVAGSLGAPEVQQVAATLEKAISSRSDSNVLESTLEKFGLVLKDFVNRLSSALPQKTPTRASGTVAIDTDQAKQVVQEMIGYLNNFDPSAGDCLEIHDDIFRTLLSESFDKFEKQIGTFAFADAIVTLQQAMNLFRVTTDPS
jgi:two-component system sensor histidine kinase/response regulator